MIQHFKRWKFCPFFYFLGSFLPSWIRIRIQQLKLMRIHADPDPDTDPKPWPDESKNCIKHKKHINYGTVRTQLVFFFALVILYHLYVRTFSYKIMPPIGYAGAVGTEPTNTVRYRYWSERKVKKTKQESKSVRDKDFSGLITKAISRKRRHYSIFGVTVS